MGWKELFRLNWPIFITFLVFNFLASTFLNFGGIFSAFSFFNQFTCATNWNAICYVWNPVIINLVFILNLIWQFFLANIAFLVYEKVKKK